ncbi:lysylphosphatidylglycerol synthase transmembrane domain-containing protein [Baekduia sp. Peel2402]|uniref:lysylphosphatidylglycerol synthase transmembrane domain-containing protein n=1 Tax=Baekduia sp. Peel2402 TaxID=3458296 RepID=UPI00403E7B21
MPSLARRAVALGLTALVLYGVAPAIVEVLGAWPKVADLKPWWLAGMLLFEAASCWCLWELQALSIGTRDTTAVATSQLAGGALGRVIPGGAATAAATQYNMLTTADVPRAAIATGLAAATVLQIAALCVLPAVALPVLLFGFTVPETLLETAILALGLFIAMLGLGIGVARSEGTLKGVGRFAVRVSARLPGDRTLAPEFPERLVVQRDEVVERLGDRFVRACAAAVGRWVFDLLALATAIQAVGATPRFSLVLLAYVTAQLLAQIPITPGGIGVVEAGLTATLALAGVRGGDAAVAVLAYRLVSYWLMLPAGLIAWIVHRRRLSVSAAT